jgi:hypothetical protein
VRREVNEYKGSDGPREELFPFGRRQLLEDDFWNENAKAVEANTIMSHHPNEIV